MYADKSILITGGTGSFGKKFVQSFLSGHDIPRRLIIYSRDELKQSEMRKEFSPSEFPSLRYFIGDVRDRERLALAMEGVDVVIHAAALKQVDTAEHNPTECVKTNIGGAENVIACAMKAGVTDVVALSTDKACSPVNLYGATKLVSDKLFVAANNIKGSKLLRFSVVRYGNVMGSRGSVIPFFQSVAATGKIPITHPDMTRFNISLEDGVAMVRYALENHLGGEIFVPKIPSYRILDVATAIAPNVETHIVGIRPGEKLHEEMISESDAVNTIDLGRYYAILPSVSDSIAEADYLQHHSAAHVPKGFCYSSGTNTDWETVLTLKAKIKNLVTT
jgi:UDP-N-acetylglucosamine 4,6-dehydratase/5-epimerase